MLTRILPPAAFAQFMVDGELRTFPMTLVVTGAMSSAMPDAHHGL